MSPRRAREGEGDDTFSRRRRRLGRAPAPAAAAAVLALSPEHPRRERVRPGAARGDERRGDDQRGANEQRERGDRAQRGVRAHGPQVFREKTHPRRRDAARDGFVGVERFGFFGGGLGLGPDPDPRARGGGASVRGVPPRRLRRLSPSESPAPSPRSVSIAKLGRGFPMSHPNAPIVRSSTVFVFPPRSPSLFPPPPPPRRRPSTARGTRASPRTDRGRGPRAPAPGPPPRAAARARRRGEVILIRDGAPGPAADALRDDGRPAKGAARRRPGPRPSSEVASGR